MATVGDCAGQLHPACLAVSRAESFQVCEIVPRVHLRAVGLRLMFSMMAEYWLASCLIGERHTVVEENM